MRRACGTLSAVSLRARHWSLPWIPAGAFLSFGLATLRDYGMTWDEAETWNAAASNLAMLRGLGAPWAATHVLPGYYFVIDTLRALFLEGVGALFSLTAPGDRILAHHDPLEPRPQILHGRHHQGENG